MAAAAAAAAAAATTTTTTITPPVVQLKILSTRYTHTVLKVIRINKFLLVKAETKTFWLIDLTDEYGFHFKNIYTVTENIWHAVIPAHYILSVKQRGLQGFMNAPMTGNSELTNYQRKHMFTTFSSCAFLSK
jgi:hypothetical protein